MLLLFGFVYGTFQDEHQKIESNKKKFCTTYADHSKAIENDQITKLTNVFTVKELEEIINWINRRQINVVRPIYGDNPDLLNKFMSEYDRLKEAVSEVKTVQERQNQQINYNWDSHLAQRLQRKKLLLQKVKDALDTNANRKKMKSILKEVRDFLANE